MDLEIKLCGAGFGTTHMKGSDSLRDLKEEISRRIDSAPFLLKLISKGEVLEGERVTLADFKFIPRSSCFVILLPSEDVFAGIEKKIKDMGIDKRDVYEYDPFGMLKDLQGFDQNNKILKDHNSISFVTVDGIEQCKWSFKITPVDNYLTSTQLGIPLKGRITSVKRKQIVDILSGVSHKFGLSKLSLHQAIINLDKYLSVIPCNAKRLLLVGSACLFLAATEVEMKPPRRRWVVSLLSTYHSQMEFEEMQTLISKALGYEIVSPTLLLFTRKLIETDKKAYDEGVLGFWCNYVADLALEVYDLVSLPLSKVASSIVFVARYITRPDILPWSAGMVEASHYRASELRVSAVQIYRVLVQVNTKNNTANHYGNIRPQTPEGILREYFSDDPGIIWPD